MKSTTRQRSVGVATGWELRFLAMASMVAQWSKDPHRKVGCVITNDRNQVLSLGYNGFPRGIPDDPKLYLDKSFKDDVVIHAEENAMLNANTSVEGATVYITRFPCAKCTARLIQARVKRIVHVQPPKDQFAHYGKRWTRSSKLMQAANIQSKQVIYEDSLHRVSGSYLSGDVHGGGLDCCGGSGGS
jgi:dCMP deaminase